MNSEQTEIPPIGQRFVEAWSATHRAEMEFCRADGFLEFTDELLRNPEFTDFEEKRKQAIKRHKTLNFEHYERIKRLMEQEQEEIRRLRDNDEDYGANSFLYYKLEDCERHLKAVMRRLVELSKQLELKESVKKELDKRN